MKTTIVVGAVSSEPMSIQGLNLGHCGTHLSCMQEPVGGAVVRLQGLLQKHQKRRGTIPLAWPSKSVY